MDDKASTSETEKKLTVRLPFEVWRQLREIAKIEKRSLNSQIVLLLEQGVKDKDDL